MTDEQACLARMRQLLGGGHASQAMAELAMRPLASQGPDLAYLHAVAAAQCGQRALADAALAQCLAQAPTHPGAHFQRAAFALSDGHREEARQGFEAVVRIAPGWAEAHYNLAVVQADLGDFAAAELSYRAALHAQPRLVQAANNLANLLCERGCPDEAVALMRSALGAAPEFAIGWCTLGHGLLRGRQPGPAVDALQRSLALDPTQAAAWENLGEALHTQGEIEAATQAWSRALALNPGSASLAFKLDTLRGAQPPRPPDEFVRTLFDGMAGGFDHWLVDTLGYRLPEQLGRYLPEASGLDVLDLGCGTGLAGPSLRPLARRLEGADLSMKMIEKAAERGVYDRLHQAALQDCLDGATSTWGLLLAADVFVYVGALDDVFRQAAQALHPGGWLLFSVESLPEGEAPGFRLQSTGRYAHAADYLHGLATRYGFVIELDEAIDLRREREHMLPGRVMRLRRA